MQHSPQSSRFVRPARPRHGLVLQERDREVLRALDTYRFLRSDHLQLLLFAGRSRRLLQARLRQLWEHGLVDRLYLPLVLTGLRPAPVQAGQPVYALAPAGARILLTESGSDALGLRRRDPIARASIEHDLVVSDCLTSLVVALRPRAGVAQVAVQSERLLWRAAVHAFSGQLPKGGYVVPDGAATIRFAGEAEATTFYLEVVRADVHGGNDTLRQKLARYVALNREGYFRTVFGHAKIRAVLFLTPSMLRAGHLATLAQSLRFGSRLFWFGSYALRDVRGQLVSTLSPATILSARWRSTDGSLHAFVPSDLRPSAPDLPTV